MSGCGTGWSIRLRYGLAGPASLGGLWLIRVRLAGPASLGGLWPIRVRLLSPMFLLSSVMPSFLGLLSIVRVRTTGLFDLVGRGSLPAVFSVSWPGFVLSRLLKSFNVSLGGGNLLVFCFLASSSFFFLWASSFLFFSSFFFFSSACCFNSNRFFFLTGSISSLFFCI